jgi:hypothetical protein
MIDIIPIQCDHSLACLAEVRITHSGTDRLCVTFRNIGLIIFVNDSALSREYPTSRTSGLKNGRNISKMAWEAREASAWFGVNSY